MRGVIGPAVDVEVGTVFQTRMELSRAGVHRPSMIGIAGTGKTGAESIVMNGGYEDDEDLWEYIIYTGQGGNDPVTKRQVASQELTRGILRSPEVVTRACPSVSFGAGVSRLASDPREGIATTVSTTSRATGKSKVGAAF